MPQRELNCTSLLPISVHSYLPKSVGLFSDNISQRQFRKGINSYKYQLKLINQTTKKLGDQIGLRQSLTTYVMRHAWATQALQMGIDVVKIKDGLGHDSLETTQSYLEEFDNDVIDEMNDLIAE